MMNNMEKENRFVFVCPMFNAANTITQLLNSMFGQSYYNWKLILIDDCSTQEHREECARVITLFKMLRKTDCKRIKVVWNDHKKWETENVLYGIKNFTNDDDIVCRIDADDYLCDLDALWILNQYYNQTQSDVIWTMHRWGLSDGNISNKMNNDVDPYEHPWVTSHLKTFKRHLLNDVSIDNFKNQDGDFVKRCGDQAIYLPVLYKTNKRLFVPRVLYHYTIKNNDPSIYHTDDAIFQKNEADFIRNRGFVSSGEKWDKII